MKVYSIFTATMFLILPFTNTNGQDTGFLEFKNGDRIQADVNGFHSADKWIKYNDLETGKIKRIASKELESIIIINADDSLVFNRMKLKTFGAFGKLKDGKGLVWVAKLYGTEKMEGYFYSASDNIFTIDAFGNKGHNTFLSPAQAIRVAPEDYVLFIGLTDLPYIGGKRTTRIMMNKFLKKYLKDFCPAFSDKMHKNSYEVTELKNIIDDYTTQCE